MLTHLFKRLLASIPLLIGITIISFAVMHLAPGEPIGAMTDMNPKVSAQARQRMRELYGLDKPLYVQYWDWLKRIVKLDFGRSFAPDQRPVWDKIAERLPITVMINVLDLLIIFVIAIPIGVVAASRQHSRFDRITTLLVFLGFATPTFWLALLLMIWLGVDLGWLPISGLHSLDYELLPFWEQIWDTARHLAMPIFVSAFGGIAGVCRYTRANMLEVIRQDYITTARAKGLSQRRVIYKHALRNALLPVITILGLSIPGLIGGGVIFETIFAIPGMGQLFYQSVMMRDYPVVMGILVIGAVLTLLGNLIADISYSLADPRIKYK